MHIYFRFDYDPLLNAPVSRRYAISLEKEFMIYKCQYPVASRDPNVDPREIPDDFHAFGNLFRTADSEAKSSSICHVRSACGAPCLYNCKKQLAFLCTFFLDRLAFVTLQTDRKVL